MAGLGMKYHDRSPGSLMSRKTHKKISKRAEWDWIEQEYKIPNDDNMIILGELTWDEVTEIVMCKERGELRADLAFWDALGKEIEFRRQVGYKERKLIRQQLL